MEGKYEKGFKVFICKPGGVLTNGLAKMIMPGSFTIGQDELAASLIDVALNGNKNHTLENRELADKGRTLLARTQ